MSARALSIQKVSQSNLRAFDIRRDLMAVADLVELCFKDTLDADGHLYIHQMRQTARNNKLVGLASRSASNPNMPPGGFVWVEDDRLIGNLSLVPVIAFGIRRYLIANVAVHPDYRRLGIAYKLTEAALKRAQQQSADEIWLQVDESNQAAQKLYQQMGFIERARRITWQAKQIMASKIDFPDNLRIREQRLEDWPMQLVWLKNNYPTHIQWNLPLNFKLFEAGWRGTVQRLFGERQIQQWGAEINGQLAGVLTWQSSSLQSDRLWLASEASVENQVLPALLSQAQKDLSARRPLLFNYPKDREEDTFLEMGFKASRRLIWMQNQNSP
jgi:ribosomal protein S18 acetylase RimI-like enzyme